MVLVVDQWGDVARMELVYILYPMSLYTPHHKPYILPLSDIGLYTLSDQHWLIVINLSDSFLRCVDHALNEGVDMALRRRGPSSTGSIPP